jgi:hypothetical protein
VHVCGHVVPEFLTSHENVPAVRIYARVPDAAENVGFARRMESRE